jgi:putative aldouronate transport system substrate-binding protein
MRKLNKKIASVALLLMLTAALIGEGKNEANSASDSSGGMAISWASWVLGPVDDDSYAERVLEEEFPNVDIKFLAFERSTWHDQINTRLAAGDTPDIIYRDAPGNVREYVNQGLLAEIPFEMAREHANGIFSASLDYGGEVWLACNIDGKNYGLPIMQPEQTRPFTNAWRKDWLTNVGIEKIPETIDEFEEAFKRFTYNDPDGNGKDDTYGLSFPGKSKSWALFMSIFTAYGVDPIHWNMREDGTIGWGWTDPRIKEGLVTLNKWYNEGYIDPEFITTDNKIIQAKWKNGNFGYMTFGKWYNFLPGSGMYDGVLQVTPSAEIVLGPAPKGPRGDFGYTNWGKITSSTTFGKHLEEEQDKLIKCLEIVDKVVSDTELFGKMKYGEEGTHWKRDVENNGVSAIEPFNNNQQKGPIGNNFFNALPAIPEIQDFYGRNDSEELYKYAVMGNVKDNEDFFTWVDKFIDSEISKQASEAAQIIPIWMIEFIIGNRDIKEFDDFVAEWESLGGSLLTEEANRAYNEGEAKIYDIISELN